LGDLGDIGLDRDSFAAEGLYFRHDFVGCGSAVCVVDNHRGAAFSELEGDACAKTAAEASYQGDFAVEAGSGLLHGGRW